MPQGARTFHFGLTRARGMDAIASLACVVVAVSAGFGCARTDAAMQITLAGASPGGAWSAIGEALTDELRKGLPGVAVTLEPGQDGANAALVQSGRVELGLVHASIARAAIAGSFPFDNPQPDVRAVMLLYANAPFHFIVDRRSGIMSFDDLRTRHLPLRVSVNTRGSLMELATRTTLEAYGVTYEAIDAAGGDVLFYPFATSFEVMQRRRLDAVASTVQVPNSQTLDATRFLDLDLLPLSDEAVAFANERLGTEPATIPQGSYPFLDHDVKTFAGRVILIANATWPDNVVYAVTKALHDRLGNLRRAHGSMRELTPERLAEVGGVPLHTGAERFYREQGLLR